MNMLLAKASPSAPNTGPSAEPASAAGATDQSYLWLRKEILDGTRAPNDQLRFDALRKESGFGVSSLREALVRLEGERFVVASHNRGFRVAPLTLDELRDINDARVLVETRALALAIEHGDIAWEGEIVSALHQLKRQATRETGKPGSPFEMEWEHRHYMFHRSLIAACRSQWLLRVFDLLYPQYQRYRRYIWLHAKQDVLERDLVDVLKQHDNLVQATLDRDAEKAVELLREHYDKNVDVLLKICEQTPGLLGSAGATLDNQP